MSLMEGKLTPQATEPAFLMNPDQPGRGSEVLVCPCDSFSGKNFLGKKNLWKSCLCFYSKLLKQKFLNFKTILFSPF